MRIHKATRVSIDLRQEHPPQTPQHGHEYGGFQAQYFVVLVDGVVAQLNSTFANATFGTGLCSNVTDTRYVIADNLDPTTPHDIRVFKSSEAQWAVSVPEPNFLTLRAIWLASTKAGSAPAILDPPPLPRRKIEFIGDSMMAGYCNILWVPDIDRHKTNRSNIESFWLSWPTRVCESVQAQCHTAAWSGFALMRSRYCNKPVTMPEIWRRTIASANKSDWVPSVWIPDALVGWMEFLLFRLSLEG